MENSNAKYTSMTEPMQVDISDDAESINIKLTAKIEAVVEAIQSLEDHAHQLGEKDEKKSNRKQMKDELTKAEYLIQETENLLRQFETMKMKKKDEWTKIIKRTKDTFKQQKEKFTKVKKLIEAKEKILIDHKTSNDIHPGNTLGGASTHAHSDLQIHVQDLESYEKVNQEREKDVQEIRNYAHQLKGLAQDQADRLQEQSETIDVVEHHIEDTEENTVKGNKELDKKLESQKTLSKRNMICCATMAVTCGIVIAIIAIDRFL
jgi:chromosome segregation ATPase